MGGCKWSGGRILNHRLSENAECSRSPRLACKEPNHPSKQSLASSGFAPCNAKCHLPCTLYCRTRHALHNCQTCAAPQENLCADMSWLSQKQHALGSLVTLYTNARHSSSCTAFGCWQVRCRRVRIDLSTVMDALRALQKLLSRLRIPKRAAGLPGLKGMAIGIAMLFRFVKCVPSGVSSLAVASCSLAL